MALGGLCRRAARGIIEDVRFYRRSATGWDRAQTASVFVTGVSIAIFAYFITKNYFETKAQQEFEGPATQFTAVLTEAIDRYVEVVNSVGAFFTASNDLDRWEFFEFTRESLPRYPGVQSLQWIPQVAEIDRAGYERRANRDGLFGFRFTELSDSGQVIEAAKRRVHYPVFYIEPFEGNERVLGSDLAAEPREMEVLNLARDIGAMVATRKSPVSTEGPARPRFSVVLPIFRADAVPETIQERRSLLIGFVRGIFRVDELVKGALPQLTAPPGLDIYIFDRDATGGEGLLYYHPSPLRRDRSGPLSEARAIQNLYTMVDHQIAGWQWSILVKPVSSHYAFNAEIAATGAVAIFILFTALLLQIMVSSQTRTQAIERSVRERTAELSAANTALEAEIKERRRVELELRTAKDQAEVANRAKSEFLAMMSHELRTPLNAIIGFSEILSEETLGPMGSGQYRDYARDIRMSGTHLLSLINDILDLSKIEAKRFELYEETVDLAELLNNVQPIIQERLEATKLSFKAEFAEPRHQLRADPRAVRQMLINLLSNSIKFTPEDGTITLRTRIAQDGCFVIEVSDTGIGIAEEDQEAVLLPFDQVDSSLSRKYEGTGLGLPLTKRLVELHGGQLEIESSLGVGTTVSLVFPKERIVEGMAQFSEATRPLLSPPDAGKGMGLRRTAGN